jgi:hypothetical protein
MENGVYDKVAEYLTLIGRTELLTCSATQTSFTRIRDQAQQVSLFLTTFDEALTQHFLNKIDCYTLRNHQHCALTQFMYSELSLSELLEARQSSTCTICICYWMNFPSAKTLLGRLEADGRIILQRILQKWDRRAWPGLNWLRIGISKKFVWILWWIIGFHRLLGIWWLGVGVLASQETICSVGLDCFVSCTITALTNGYISMLFEEHTDTYKHCQIISSCYSN